MNLELKIPPPVVALLLAGAMWLLSTAMPRVDTPAALRIGTALAIAAAGGAFSLAGMLAFRRAKTTVNPLRNSSPVLRNRDELGVFFFWVALQRLRVLRVGRPLSVPQATPVFQTSQCSLALGARSRRERRHVSLTLWTTLQRLCARCLDVKPPS